MAKEDKSLPPETINMLYDDVDKIFYADKAAMMLHGSWLAARIETVAPNLEGKIGLAPNPAYPRTQGRGTNAGGWGVGLTTKDPEKYQPAWDFIYLLVGGDPDYKLEILLEGGNLPVQRSMAEVWKPKLIKPEWVEIIMDELQYAKTRPAVEIYPDASLEWSQAFQEVIMGVKTTEQALKDATERVIEIAEEKGYIE